jgi:hypothetical protein
VTQVEQMNLTTREEHGYIREEVHTVEPNAESASGGRVEAFVSTGDLADCGEIVLVSDRNFTSQTKRRVIADEQSRFQQRTEGRSTLDRKALRVSLVEDKGQLSRTGVVGVLNKLFDDSAAEREPGAAGHLLQKRADGLRDVVLLATRLADCGSH